MSIADLSFEKAYTYEWSTVVAHDHLPAVKKYLTDLSAACSEVLPAVRYQLEVMDVAFAGALDGSPLKEDEQNVKVYLEALRQFVAEVDAAVAAVATSKAAIGA